MEGWWPWSPPQGLGWRGGGEVAGRHPGQGPNWNGGGYYDKGGVTGILTEMRVATLKRYGIDEQLAAKFPDKEAREAEIKRRAETWSKVFDANSLVVLRKASVRFDAEKDMARIKAKVLYVLSRTDKLFPPSIAPDVMAKLKAAGVSADYFEIDSDFGHSASGLDAAEVGAQAEGLHGGFVEVTRTQSGCKTVRRGSDRESRSRARLRVPAVARRSGADG